MNRLRLMISLVPLGLGAALLGFAGCSRQEPPTATSPAKVVGTTNTVVISPREVSPSATTAIDQHVVGYTDRVGPSLMGWAFGHEQIAFDGGFFNINFKKCNAMVPSCGGIACSGVCTAPGQTPAPAGWMGDASLVTDGRGQVVYVTLGDGDGNPANGAELVIATLSTDNGTTFGVNLTDTLVVNAGNCNDGTQDLPDAAMDFTTEPPTIWVVWRHRSKGSFGGCIARGTVVSGVLAFDTPKSISNMDREDSASTDMGQGGLRVQAGDGAVTVMYSNNDQLEKCPKPTHLAWKSVTSFDNGSNWTDHSLIFHTKKFPSCLVNGTVNNTLRAFDLVRTTDGNYFAAVQDDNDTIRVFYSAQIGVKPDNGDTTWRELCFVNPNVPHSDWLEMGAECKQAAFGAVIGKSVLYPTLAADLNSRISLLFYESTTADDAIFPSYRGFAAPRLPSVIVNPRFLDAPTKPVLEDGGVVTPYLTMSAGAAPQSIPNLGRLSCLQDDPFFPFWLEPDGLITRRVTLTGP